MLVRAPASSANLGPGFDCLALALDLPFWLSAGSAAEVGGDRGHPPHLPPGEGDDPHDPVERVEPVELLVAERTHPASVAFLAAGGPVGVELWWRSQIPPGRGQGFSGAARVAGAFLARRLAGDDAEEARGAARGVAAELEGHADNAAASAWGSFTVSAGAVDTRLDVPTDLVVELWWPEDGVRTDASRRELPATVALPDAAFSVARAATWVAAMAGGDTSLLRSACEDRLHQPTRLAALEPSSSALSAFLADPGVLAVWLSGSGPTVAALVRTDHEVVTSFPPGRRRRVAVDRAGVVEVPIHP